MRLFLLVDGEHGRLPVQQALRPGDQPADVQLWRPEGLLLYTNLRLQDQVSDGILNMLLAGLWPRS